MTEENRIRKLSHTTEEPCIILDRDEEEEEEAISVGLPGLLISDLAFIHINLYSRRFLLFASIIPAMHMVCLVYEEARCVSCVVCRLW